MTAIQPGDAISKSVSDALVVCQGAGYSGLPDPGQAVEDRGPPARLAIAAEGSEAGDQIVFNAARDVDEGPGWQKEPLRRRSGFRPPALDGLNIPPGWKWRTDASSTFDQS